MIDYNDLILAMVQTSAKSIIVFLCLGLILDYLRQMLFSNR